MVTVLGLDCSTTTVGWGFIDFDIIDDGYKINKIETGWFKPTKKGSLFDKFSFVQDKILELCKQFNPDKIAIEDILKVMPSRSSAGTIITLAVANRNIGMTCYRFLGNKDPNYFPVITIRHTLKIDGVVPSKQEVPDFLSKILNFDFPYEFNKKNKLKEENFDKADGLAVAATFMIKSLPVKPKSKKKKDKKVK